MRPAALRARAQRSAAQQQRGGLAGADRPSGGAHRLDAGMRHGFINDLHHRGVGRQLGPGRVGRQDQGGDIARMAACHGDGFGGIRRHRLGRHAALDPVRHRARHAFDIAGQRRVVLHVVGGVVADDVDHRRARALGVVQVGQAVAQARAQVQQRGGRLVGHARIAIGRARHHAFEQAQHAAHLRFAIQRRDEVHLGRARVGEADVHIIGQKGIAKTISAVHRVSLVVLCRQGPAAARRPDWHDR